MNPERGFATNLLMGPATIDPKLRAELNDKYRKDTDGALSKMNQIRGNLSGSLDDAAAVGSGIDGLNAQFAALRTAIDKALDGPAEPRKDAVKKIVGDNAVFNTAVTKLLDARSARSPSSTATPTGRPATPTSPGPCATSAATIRACTRTWSAPSARRPKPKSWI